MEFLSADQFRPHPEETVYRYPRLGLTISMAVLVVIGSALVVFIFTPDLIDRSASAPIFVLYWMLAVAVLGLSFLDYFRRARSLPSNWLLRTDPQGLTLKFRSYLNHHFDPADICIVRIPYKEIEWAKKTRERRIHKGSGQGEREVHFHTWLDLKLCSRQLETLAEHLQSERMREAPWRRTWYGRTRGKASHNPVRLLKDGVLRIEYGVRPGLKQLFQRLQGRVVQAPPAQRHTDVTQLQDATRATQEAQILELIEMGDSIQAIKVAQDLYGLSATEAKRFADEFRTRQRPA